MLRLGTLTQPHQKTMSNVIPTAIVPSIQTTESPQDSLAQAVEHYQLMVAFVRQMMRENQDYGIIPGTGNKPVLLKPGAEKLCRLFGLRPHFELAQSVTDFDKPLFYYHYRCTLYNRNGEALGQGDGNCNSMEAKYKRQQHKIWDLTNTLCKMAQKRALLQAVLIVCGASEFFCQDLLDEQDSAVESQPSAADEKESLVARVGELVKVLGWTTEQAQGYLSQHYGVKGRQQLSVGQLRALIEKLEAIKKQQR
jgi:hypothetical protein